MKRSESKKFEDEMERTNIPLFSRNVWDADPRAARAALRPRHPAQPDGAQAKNKNQTYYGRRRSFFDQQNFFNHKINF